MTDWIVKTPLNLSNGKCVSFHKWSRAVGGTLDPRVKTLKISIYGAPLQLWSKEKITMMIFQIATLCDASFSSLDAGNLRMIQALMQVHPDCTVPRECKLAGGGFIYKIVVKVGSPCRRSWRDVVAVDAWPVPEKKAQQQTLHLSPKNQLCIKDAIQILDFQPPPKEAILIPLTTTPAEMMGVKLAGITGRIPGR